MNDVHMQNSPLVSIIVPVYKVEKYIRRCVESIIAQTYRNIEVILVDDGSPDNCGKICDEYAHKYPNIYVIHQKNSGQAAARNRASEIANGEFITFIDSDDFVEFDYVEYLLGLQQKYLADVSIGVFYYLYEGHTPPKRDFSKETDEKLDAIDTLRRMNYNKGFGAMAWAKLYRKELILKHPFPEGQIYEDLATLYKIIGDCSTVAFGNRIIYYWVQRTGSTMRMEFDERQMAGMAAAEAQIEYMAKNFPDALKSAKYRHTAKAIELIAICFNSGADKNVFQRLRNSAHKYAEEVLQDNHAKTTMKIRIFATMAGYFPARIVFNLHEKAKKKLV